MSDTVRTLFKGDRIAAVEANISAEGAQVIDAAGNIATSLLGAALVVASRSTSA